MKFLAIFLLLTFSGTILVPLAMSLTQQNQISLFIVDEEKSGNANPINELKEEKKEHSGCFLLSIVPISINVTLTNGDGRSLLLPPSPYLEYIAPPPNVC